VVRVRALGPVCYATERSSLYMLELSTDDMMVFYPVDVSSGLLIGESLPEAPPAEVYLTGAAISGI